MAEKTIQVTEWMGDFVKWVYELGEDKVREVVRDHLKELKEHADKTNNVKDSDGAQWDDALEPNDDVDQWKHGGDCNLCRKIDYCLTKCRPNKLLKKITTPLLYQMYLDENPEAAAKVATEQSKGMTPEQMLGQLGALQ